MIHIVDEMMIVRWNKNILTIIETETGKVKTLSPAYIAFKR